MQIQFPTKFEIEYPPENGRYYNYNRSRRILTGCLLQKSRGFCMYCGKTLVHDGDLIFHMEHSVDKAGNENQTKDEKTFLTHCKFNFSVACVKCNEQCKKQVEKIDISEADKEINCLSKKCEEMCPEYIAARNLYIEKNAIILQPQGYTNEGIEYGINYNLLKHIYEPNIENKNPKEYFFIQNHIERFRLNNKRFSYGVIDVAVKVINFYENGVHEMSGIFSCLFEDKVENIMEYIFIDYLKTYFEQGNVKELVEFCELLVLLDAVN